MAAIIGDTLPDHAQKFYITIYVVSGEMAEIYSEMASFIASGV